MRTFRVKSFVDPPGGSVRALLLGTAVLAFAAAPCFAIVDYDPFDYVGTELNGQNGGTVWNGPWITTATQTNELSNDGISLSYPVPFEASLTTPATSGSRVSTGGFGGIASNYRVLTEPIPLDTDGTTRFASALFRKNLPNGSAVDNVLVEFFDNVGAGNRRWGMGIQGTEDKPWLNANGSSSPSGPTVTAGSTYFIVTKIVSSALGSDMAFLKVFGPGYGTEVPQAEPETWDLTLSETSDAVLDRVRVRIDSANPAEFPGMVDELRIADSWAEVIGQPGQQIVASGDYNQNGIVDAADYTIWRQNVGQAGGSTSLGDSEPDGDVDAADYDYWAAHFGSASGFGAASSTSIVPEPGLIWLQFFGQWLIFYRRRA